MRGQAQLRTLRGTEHHYGERLLRMREDGSPLTVAYEDPVLRSAGLKADSYGAALFFFDLSHGDLHRIVCHCHFGDTMSAQQAATLVRAAKTNRAMQALRAATLGGAALMLMAGVGAIALLP